MTKRVMIGLGVLALVLLAASGGYLLGKSAGQTEARQAMQQMLPGGWGGQGAGVPGPNETRQPGQQAGSRPGGGTMGTIESIDGSILVIKTQEGTVQVTTSDTTLIEKYASVGIDALETGEQVLITGIEQDDGSIAARSIRVQEGFGAAQADQP